MELTLDQAREIARLRRRWPSADVVVHRRERDVILEVRRGSQAVAVERFGDDGTVSGQQPLRLAA